jgi:tRNA dimethylallyltransferase
LVGGTVLYFKALTEGLAAVPPVPAEIRAQVRARLQNDGVAPLYAELIERDPVTAARLMPLDRVRIARALEVILATGRSLSEWHQQGMAPLINPAKAVKIFLNCERTELVSRIDRRFAAMLEAGAFDEVRALAARNLDPLLPAMKAHGVPWLIRHLNGEISQAVAAEGAVMDTRRYAKRQVTWFRGQMKDWTAVAPDVSPDDVAAMMPE